MIGATSLPQAGLGLLNSAPLGRRGWPVMGVKPLRSSMCSVEKSSYRVAGNCRSLPCGRQGRSPRGSTAHGSRVRINALKAHRFVSPGNPLGTRGPQTHRAPKGRNSVIPIARGGRGTVRIPAPSGHDELWRSGCPGRGPGLANSRPVGAVRWRAGGGIRIEVIGLLRTPLWHEFAGAVVEERRSIPGAGRALSAPNPLSGAFLVLDTFEGSGR